MPTILSTTILLNSHVMELACFFLLIEIKTCIIDILYNMKDIFEFCDLVDRF